MLNRLAGAAGMGLLLAGCTLGPDFAMPHLFAPSTWFASRPAPPPVASRTVAEPIDPDWWKLFNDPVLTALEEQVAGANLDVRLAGIRLLESRQQRAISAVDQFPTLNANGSYTREEISNRGVIGLLSGGGGGGGGSSGGGSSGGGSTATSSNGLGGTSGAPPTSAVSSSKRLPPFNLWQYGFDASWELDLWGRVRRNVESADASLLASAESRRNTLLTSLAEVARDYIQLRGTQRDLAIAKETLASESASLRITQERQRAGLTTELDVTNASAQVDSTAAQIPQLEQSIAASINALSLLLGETPGALADRLATPQPVPPVPPSVPVGLPSELAQRRPDIRQAEAQLHVATAEIGAAEADFFPKVTLSGSVGLQAVQFKNLGNWDARQYSGGPSISLPIFEGGRLVFTLELRKAQQQEAAAQYQQTVLQAFHDVDNALTAYAAEQRRRDSLQKSVVQARRAVGLSQEQYKQGLVTFLDVLTAQRTQFTAEQSYADSTTTVSTNLVQLYKALGGGWEGSFPRDGAGEKAPRLF